MAKLTTSIDAPISAERSFSTQIKKVTSIAPFKLKIYTDATYTYLCKARNKTVLATTNWQITRYDADGSCDHADGDLKFDNLATDLTAVQAISYS